MKKILLINLILIFLSCQEKKNTESNTQIQEENKQEILDEIESPLKTETINNENIGVILSPKIDVYKSFKIVNTIDSTYGLIVKIDTVSKEKHYIIDSDDRCDLHNFVYVSSEKVNDWIYGKHLFQRSSNRDTTIVEGDNEITIIPTENFSIGIYDEKIEGLSFCQDGYQSPVIISYNETSSIVKIDSEHYNQEYWTLDAHDGWYDSIVDSKLTKNNLKLKIRREYQEGLRVIDLTIKLDTTDPSAEVTSVSEIEY